MKKTLLLIVSAIILVPALLFAGCEAPSFKVAGKKGDTGARGVRGDTGAPGVSGDTGAPGVSGDTGAQGVSGFNGFDGDDGDDGDDGLSHSEFTLSYAAKKFTFKVSRRGSKITRISLFNAEYGYFEEILLRNEDEAREYSRVLHNNNRNTEALYLSDYYGAVIYYNRANIKSRAADEKKIAGDIQGALDDNHDALQDIYLAIEAYGRMDVSRRGRQEGIAASKYLEERLIEELDFLEKQ